MWNSLLFLFQKALLNITIDKITLIKLYKEHNYVKTITYRN